MAQVAASASVDMVGDYLVGYELGRGGFGVTYYGTHKDTGREVAIKVCTVGRRELIQEARLMGQVTAPGFPRPVLCEVREDLVALVMEFISGPSLAQAGRLPYEQVIGVGVSVGRSLMALHGEGLIHKDIKPANIILSPAGPYIVDFGLSKQVDENTRAMAVSSGFSPPEQYTGGTDQRADVYALGATLYKALTGQVPPAGIGRLIIDRLDHPMVYCRNIPPALDAAIFKAMAPDPADRWETMADFVAALEDAGPARTPRPKPAPEPLTPWGLIRNKLITIMIIITILFSFLALLYTVNAVHLEGGAVQNNAPAGFDPVTGTGCAGTLEVFNYRDTGLALGGRAVYFLETITAPEDPAPGDLSRFVCWQ